MKLERSISERVSPQNGLYAGGQKMRSDPAMCFFVPVYLNPISDAHASGYLPLKRLELKCFI